MKIHREDTEFRRSVVIETFEGGHSGQIRVERARDFGRGGGWKPARLSWGAFSPAGIEETRAYGLALVEAARIAEEMNAEEPAVETTQIIPPN